MGWGSRVRTAEFQVFRWRFTSFLRVPSVLNADLHTSDNLSVLQTRVTVIVKPRILLIYNFLHNFLLLPLNSAKTMLETITHIEFLLLCFEDHGTFSVNVLVRLRLKCVMTLFLFERL